MLRLTFLLCSGLFLAMLLGGRDFGQLRPGLALAEAEAKAAPLTAAVPAVQTASLVSEAEVVAVVVADPVINATPSLPMPIVRPPVLAAPVLAATVLVSTAEATPVPEAENTVFTLSNYADPAPDAVAIAAPEQVAEGEIWYVSGRSLNVRAGPSTDDAVVGKLARGEAMLVVAREGDDWARIKIEGDGIEGYVATRFLTPEVPVLN